MRKLFVSKAAIEKMGLPFFENIKCYDIRFGNFGGFDINGYTDDYNRYAGVGVTRPAWSGDLYFYDDDQKEEVVFIKNIK